MNTTQRHLDEMQLRTAEHDVPGGPADRELTEMKQRLIVERASAVLFEKGFHGTSIRDIAAACDMSMGQLYHYISSKDDILFLMHLYSQEQWHHHLSEGGFEQITDPVARLEHGLRISMKYLSENRASYSSSSPRASISTGSTCGRLWSWTIRTWWASTGTCSRRSPATGRRDRGYSLPPAPSSFLCTFLSLRGWNLDLPDERAVDASIDFLVDFILRGLGIERG